MYSILIVDDEPIVKIALRSILPWEEHGFSICGTASNGLEALPLIEQHHPDVIITDLKRIVREKFWYLAITRFLILCEVHCCLVRQIIC